MRNAFCLFVVLGMLFIPACSKETAPVSAPASAPASAPSAKQPSLPPEVVGDPASALEKYSRKRQ